MSKYLVLVVILSGLSFWFGWVLAGVNLKEEKEELDRICKKALEDLEPITRSEGEKKKGGE